eukprot:3761999-Rhodomonas_salina.4
MCPWVDSATQINPRRGTTRDRVPCTSDTSTDTGVACGTTFQAVGVLVVAGLIRLQSQLGMQTSTPESPTPNPR